MKSPSSLLVKQEHENKFIVELETSQNNLFIKSISTAYKWEGDWKKRNYETNIQESEFKFMNTGQAFWVNDRLREFDVYHFHDTSDTSPMKAMSDIHDNHRLRRDGSNLAAFLYYLKEKRTQAF